MIAPPEQLDPVMQAIAVGSRDANNPSARAFAVKRLQQLVHAGLLGGMPQNMADPTEVWRGLSSTLAGNPDVLTRFLAAGQQQPAAQQQVAQLAGNGYTVAAPALVSEHGYQAPVAAAAPQLVSEHGYQPPLANQRERLNTPFLHGGHQLPGGPPPSSIARLRAALQAAMQQPGARMPFGRHR